MGTCAGTANPVHAFQTARVRDVTCNMEICCQNEKSDCLTDLLTLRELEVLELLSDGSSTDEIANDELAIPLAVSGSDVDAD